MKVNKLKKIFSGVIIGAAAFGVTNVSAATLNFSEGVKENNTITYEIFVTPNEGESLANKQITVSCGNSNIEKSYTNTDETIARCGGDTCKIFTDITSKTSIAKIVLTNTSQTENTGVSISLLPDSDWAEKINTQAINLEGKEVITTTQKVLSTNAELTNLTVSVGTMSPAFTQGERNYTVNGIKDTVNSVTFNPTCDNCKTEFVCIENCTVSETKNNRIMLVEGANTISLTTTSEDGKTTLEYNFTVYRGEVEEPSAYLKELSIKDGELSPKFDMLLNDYSVSVDLDVEKIEIEYTLEDPEANVEIKGADKLKEGENTVTVTVTSSDGKSKQVYTITVNKEDLCDPEKEDCDKEEEETKKEPVIIEKKKSNKTLLIILLVIGALTIIGISGFIIFRKKKNKNNNDDKNNKNNKSGKKEKIKNAFIEPEIETEAKETTLEEDLLKEDLEPSEKSEEIIKPRIKPSVDEALEDLMKTKEIELNNL